MKTFWNFWKNPSQNAIFATSRKHDDTRVYKTYISEKISTRSLKQKKPREKILIFRSTRAIWISKRNSKLRPENAVVCFGAYNCVRKCLHAWIQTRIEMHVFVDIVWMLHSHWSMTFISIWMFVSIRPVFISIRFWDMRFLVAVDWKIEALNLVCLIYFFRRSLHFDKY